VENGKLTTIELRFVDEARTGPVKRFYGALLWVWKIHANKYFDTALEVKDKASPSELAAVVHFSRRVETPAYFDFYRSLRGGDVPANWQGDTPKSCQKRR
jgi:hypothetical protein